MRNVRNKFSRVVEVFLFNQVAPKFARDLKRLRDFYSFRNVYRPIRLLRSILSFAVGSMAGARVMPGIRTFQARAIHPLKNMNVDVRIKFFQNGA